MMKKKPVTPVSVDGPSWHSLALEEVIRRLSSIPDEGLTAEEARRRFEAHGANALPAKQGRSVLSIFLHQFLSPLIYLLLAAAVIAFFVGESRDAIVILFVVFLNAVIGAFQEGRAEQSMEALRKLSTVKCRVLRGGKEETLETSLVVPGDLLLLGAGDAVPADARLVEAAALSAAEAALTGESVPVPKSVGVTSEDTPLAERSNMLYAGTHVTSGRARAVVVTTGTSNEIGHIADLAAKAEHPKTQLELRIHQFGKYLVVLAAIVFTLVLGVGLLRGIPFVEIFMVAISQMVSLVPEGLPVAVTIALSVGVQRMAKRGTVVRRLPAVETLGSTTIICSDKTGTLTRNEMTVTALHLPDGREIAVTGIGYAPEGKFIGNGHEIDVRSDDSLRRLLEAGALCNDSRLVPPSDTIPAWAILGDPTEAALLTVAKKAGLSLESLNEQNPRRQEIPFDSAIKMMATEHETPSGRVIYVKGAPDVLLDFCGKVYRQGRSEPMSEALLAEIGSAGQRLADQALRVLAMGVVENAMIGDSGFDSIRGQVTFLGLMGQLDPPRIEVEAAVRECKAAGIRPVMVTGDHKITAVAIARALGISQASDIAVDGKELDKLTDDDLARELKSIRVFARVRPAQKLRIVEAYQKQGEVVAMTGDGVNDAPALVKANVGVAMGITGTEVAKEAAKIVITDDNFTTIVKAVAEGRLVYQNIKKTILFLLSTSCAEVIVLFLALIAGFPPPFTAVQILWNNLVTEGIITINLVMDRLEGDEMTRPPIPANEPLLTRLLLTRMAFMIPTIAGCTLGWFLYRLSQGIAFDLVQSETFTLLVVCEWYNVLNCRSETRSALSLSLFKNYWLVGGLILGNLLHVAVIFWPPLNALFHTVPIGTAQVFQIAAVGSIVLWVGEIRKIVLRRRKATE